MNRSAKAFVVDGSFTLAQDGDSLEQVYWHRFIANRFPTYEAFWQMNVVSVTRREIDRGDIRFRSDAELAAVGRTHEDLAIAQLHYTVMVHLGRAHELLGDVLDRWAFAEVFVRLAGASDCADELLERATNRGKYDAWSESAGRQARNRWRDLHGRPLQNVHDYRNRLVHGRVVPEINVTLRGEGEPDENLLIFPQLDKVDDHLDWRASLSDPRAALERGDFRSAQVIATETWGLVADYCHGSWKTHLLPRAV